LFIIFDNLFLFEAYILSVILSLVGLLTTGIVQPLSLYVCPLQIIVSIIISLIRREFKEFWSGKNVRNYIKFVFLLSLKKI
jgi:hypothetical protein